MYSIDDLSLAIENKSSSQVKAILSAVPRNFDINAKSANTNYTVLTQAYLHFPEVFADLLADDKLVLKASDVLYFMFYGDFDGVASDIEARPFLMDLSEDAIAIALGAGVDIVAWHQRAKQGKSPVAQLTFHADPRVSPKHFFWEEKTLTGRKSDSPTCVNYWAEP